VSLLTSLVSYWKLDEASGNRADAHGSSTLADNNTVASAAGKIGTAADFTAASSESLTCADNASLSTGDIDFTVSCWVKLKTLSGNTTILAKANDTSSAEANFEYFLGFVSSSIFFDVSNGTTSSAAFVSSAGVNDGNWHFLIGWHDSVANTLNIQLDNGTPASTSYSDGSFDSGHPFCLGKGVGFNFLNGYLDEVGFWKRTLTTQERTDLYNGGAGLAYSSFAPASVPRLTLLGVC
jgi:hypothetical protein